MTKKKVATKSSTKVLVVDDQTASRSILTELLQNITPKLTIIQKSHPQEALDWAVHHPTDMVLVDYMMPDMNGIHFTRILRTIDAYRYIPIVMVTVMDDKEIKQRALEAGVTEFLAKPINLQECITRCQNLLSMQHQQTHLSEERSELENQLHQAKQSIANIEQETIQLILHLIYREKALLNRVQRIAHYAKLLGEVHGLNPQEQSRLEQASLLFEIQTLQTAGEIQTATQLLGASHSSLFKTAADIATHHLHPYKDSMQAKQKQGLNIPLFARIVAIASFFDAQSFPADNTKDHASLSVAAALARLASDAGVHFDPNLVKQLISIRPRLEKVYEGYMAKRDT